MDYIIPILHSLSKYGSTTRSVVKYMLRMITGQCELERLCQHTACNFNECHEVEYCLYHSKYEDIRRLLVTDSIKIKDAMQTVLRIKRIVPEKDLVFLSSMSKYLRKIISYNMLLSEVDQIRSIGYDETNDEHEKLLNDVWLTLKSEPIDERYTKRWGEIGFQGKNPATDFRGMGILSLKNLMFMLNNSKDIGLKIFGQSKHPQFEYPFAVAAINLTAMSFELLKHGKLKGYLYNLEDTPEYTFVNYQMFFVDLFNEFSTYYIECEPVNVMAFNQIKDEYKKNVVKRLEQGRW